MWLSIKWRCSLLRTFQHHSASTDFNFQRFPFDKQEFFIAVDSLIPTDSFYFVPSKDFTEIGEQLGEEEWFITLSRSVS